MTRGPQSPRGRKAKGDKAELRAKRWVERDPDTLFVMNGAPSEPGADLIAFYKDARPRGDVFEVKSGDWNRLSSFDRVSAARAGDLWRSRGFRHAVIDRASWPESRIFTVTLRDGRASMLLKPTAIDLNAPGSPQALGVSEGAGSGESVAPPDALGRGLPR